MAFPLQFGSPTPVVITDGSGNSGTSANLPVIDASVGAVNATAPVFAEQIGWLDGTGKLQAVSAANPLPVTGAGGGGGSVTQGTTPWVVSGTVTANAGTNLNTSLLALEAGGNLAAIKADVDKIPSQGQALAAASMPVVLPAAQITALTPPTTVTANQGTAAASTAGWPTTSGTVAVTTQTWTTGVAGTSAQLNVTGYNTVVVTLNGSGTISTGVATYEASDDGGTTWYQVSGKTGNDLIRQTSTLSATLTILQFNVAGYTTFRARNSTTITGAGGQVIVRAQASNAVVSPSTVIFNSSTPSNVLVQASGSLTNNNAAPAATQIGVLPAIANAAAPTWTEGDQVLLSEDLAGNMRVVAGAGTALIGKVSASDETSTLYNGTTALTPSFATIAVSATGTLVALVSAKRIRVLSLSLMANGTVNVKFQSHVTPTDITGLYYLIANTGFVLPYNPLGWFQTVSGEALDINLSASIAVGGCLVYVAV